MLTADVELPVAAKCEEFIGDYNPGEQINMHGRIPGPYDKNQALLEVRCWEDIVSVTLKIQRWDLPNNEELTKNETTLRDLGDDYKRYGKVVGRTATNELGLKPETFGEAVTNNDEIIFTHHENITSDGYHEPNEFIAFICEFTTDSFWEIDDLWD